MSIVHNKNIKVQNFVKKFIEKPRDFAAHKLSAENEALVVISLFLGFNELSILRRN